MFFGCKSLISLPNIAKWNISKTSDISYMFYHCNSLISFPDIIEWKDLNGMNKYAIP